MTEDSVFIAENGTVFFISPAGFARVAPVEAIDDEDWPV